MEYNIIEQDGKYYLELPCPPGTTVYYAGPKLRIMKDNSWLFEEKVYSLELRTIEDVVDYYKRIGNSVFLSEEEAMKHKNTGDKKER